ncbi:MAG: hypothetical protein K2I82_04380, partial [Ruminococcus sp.]|nr:hypothetical protein [Ruminococcus sp.]
SIEIPLILDDKLRLTNRKKYDIIFIQGKDCPNLRLCRLKSLKQEAHRLQTMDSLHKYHVRG